MQVLPVISTVSDESTRNLVLIRLVYGKANQSHRESSILGGMLALIECDFAMELLLKTILREVRGGLVEYETWRDIKQNLSSHAKISEHSVSVDLTQVLYWHEQRNAIQHLGMQLPHATLVKALADYGKAFTKIYSKVFGMDFQSVVEADLLPKSEVQDWLKRAQRQFEQRNLQEALDLAVKAYFFVLLCAIERQLHRPYTDFLGMGEAQIDSSLWWSTHVRLQLREVGVPPQDHAWMHDLDMRLGPDRHTYGNDSLNREHVRRALDIAIETAIQFGVDAHPDRHDSPLYDREDEGPCMPISGSVMINGGPLYVYGFCTREELSTFSRWVDLTTRSIQLVSHRFGGGWYQFFVCPSPTFDWKQAAENCAKKRGLPSQTPTP